MLEIEDASKLRPSAPTPNETDPALASFAALQQAYTRALGFTYPEGGFRQQFRSWKRKRLSWWRGALSRHEKVRQNSRARASDLRHPARANRKSSLRRSRCRVNRPKAPRQPWHKHIPKQTERCPDKLFQLSQQLRRQCQLLLPSRCSSMILAQSGLVKR